MARAFMTGFEIVAQTSGNAGPDPTVSVSSATATRDTTVKRSGAASLKIVTTGAAGTGSWQSATMGTGSAERWARVYIRASRPSSECSIMRWADSSGINMSEVRLNTDGTIELWCWVGGAWVQQGSASAVALDDNTSFYRIELSTFQSAIAGADTAELRLDGTTVATFTGTLTSTANPAFLSAGWITTPGATSKEIYCDDAAANGNTGGVNDSWCGEGKIILMTPTSDGQAGSWTGGAGGTTNLWDAVNDTPPTGTTAPGTNTSQIRSADSSGDNATDEYRGDCGSYLAAGIGASDTIVAIKLNANHGEEVSTNTKTGSAGFQSNPAQTYATLTAGSDAGALGAWPSNWSWALIGTVIFDLPSVTKSSSLILAIRKTDAGTRFMAVDHLSAYVDYLPASLALPPDLLSARHTPRRRLHQRI